MNSRVFVSNAHGENWFARRLCQLLDGGSIRHFHYVYGNDIPLGSAWPSGLRERLRSSHLFVPIITSSYWQSQLCQDEYGMAMELCAAGDLRIYPYFFDDLRGGRTVPLQGRRLDDLPVDAQLDRIVRDVGQALGPPLWVESGR